MSFAQSVVLGASAFILGMVFVAQAVGVPLQPPILRAHPAETQVDIPLLYRPVTPQAIEDAYTFYGIWFEAPGAVKVGIYSASCQVRADTSGPVPCSVGFANVGADGKIASMDRVCQIL